MQPITRHPLFPAIVALWFAALCGLGSMALGTAAIERLVEATGLAKAIPMAAPPLGVTARLLVALGMTGIGGLVGAVLGRRLAAPKAAQSEPMHDLTGAFEETAEETPAAARLPGRRRSFVAPVEVPEEPEPVTAATAILQLSDLDDYAPPAPVAAPAEPEAIAHPADEHESAAQEHDDFASRLAVYAAETATPPCADEEEAQAFPHLADAFSPAAWADPEHAQDEDDEEDTEAEAPAASLFEAYARARESFAPSAYETETPQQSAPIDVAVQDDIEEAPLAAEAAPAPVSASADRIIAAPLDDLSHVELLERLALAMEEQRRKRALVQAAPLSVVPSPATQAPVQDEPETAFEDPTPPAAPMLPRFASLASAAQFAPTPPFAPAPFAPPPYGVRADYAAAAGADDEPVQPIEDLSPRDLDESESPFGTGHWAHANAAQVPEPAVVEPEASEPKAFAPTPIPAALRPVGITAFDEDDAVPGYIPPRHIVMPAAPEGAADENPSDRPMARLAGGHDFLPGTDDGDEEDEVCANLAEDDDFADDGADMVEEGVLDEGYSSLLSLQRRAAPREALISLEDESAALLDGDLADDGTTFARFDEHEAAVLSEAPIVEDGFAASHDPAPYDAATAFAAPQLPGARLFDPPGRPDPAETEKALRAALATLQRMSGAA
ncbi:hypothetical protein [Novosphingobium sp. PhB165]|uniref:hypothetical protein n=1 Tax=Novosphingobium sp. PhB165 TaxID=2485105 RepID=UPI00105223E4|nr:hypothetical protein [Novosphingobium sp. PhB165]